MTYVILPVQFCTYSLMETAANKILHAEIIDKREIHLQSPNMEQWTVACSMFLLAKLHDSVVVYEVIIGGIYSYTSNRIYIMPCESFK